MSRSPISEPRAMRAPVTAAADPVHRFACSTINWCLDAVWVHVEGELDVASRGQFERTLVDAAADTGLVVVDLRRLTFIDTAGAHTILDADVWARHGGGRLLVVPGPAQVRRLLALTDLKLRLQLLHLNPGDEPDRLSQTTDKATLDMTEAPPAAPRGGHRGGEAAEERSRGANVLGATLPTS